MDGAAAGRQARGAANRGDRFDHERAAVAKKNELRPHLSKYRKIPPDGDAAFVAAMEDVLAAYRLAHDPRFPVVCMYESSKQLVGEVRSPIPAAPGHGQIVDHEYVRHGVATLFVEVEPLAGRRHVEVTERHSAVTSHKVPMEFTPINSPLPLLEIASLIEKYSPPLSRTIPPANS